jgi:hypothetical protein
LIFNEKSRGSNNGSFNIHIAGALAFWWEAFFCDGLMVYDVFEDNDNKYADECMSRIKKER